MKLLLCLLFVKFAYAANVVNYNLPTNFEQIDFSNKNLIHSRFVNSKGKTLTFKDCSISESQFINIEVEQIIFDNCKINRVTMKNIKSQIIFKNSQIEKSYITFISFLEGSVFKSLFFNSLISDIDLKKQSLTEIDTANNRYSNILVHQSTELPIQWAYPNHLPQGVRYVE